MFKTISKKLIFTLIISSLFVLPLVIYSYYLTPSSVQEKRIDTVVTYVGSLSGQYSDSVSLSAVLKEKDSGTVLSGKLIKFVLGNQEVDATTNSQGVAQTNLTLKQSSGSQNIMAIFEGDNKYYGSSDSKQFNIYKEDTKIDYTGPLSGTQNHTVTFQAALSEQDSQVGNLANKSIRFKLGSMLRTAATNSQGKASVSVKLSISPGTYTLRTEFLGDGYYSGSFTTDSFTVKSESHGGGGGSGSSHCFIATAAFGSPLAKEVEILRKFRDKYLLKSSLGRKFVQDYYRYSPPAAKIISKNLFLKDMVRIALLPIIKSAKEFLINAER